MGKQSIIFSLLAVAIVGGIIWAITQKSDGDFLQSDEATSGIVGTSLGDTAPSFVISDSNGKNIKLSDFKKKKVLVITSFASWCPTCILEAKQFSPVYREFRDQDVEFLTISIDPSDDDEKVEMFKSNFETPWLYTHPNRDDVRQLILDYKLVRFEVTYVIDKEGTIRFKDTGITPTEQLREVLRAVVSG